MKFYLYTKKEDRGSIKRIETLINKLYPDASVEIGTKLGKYKEERLASSGVHILDVDNMAGLNNYSVAIMITDICGVGVAESVLKKL